MAEKKIESVKKSKAKSSDSCNEYVEKMLEAEIDPIEMLKYPVYSFSGEKDGIFTVLRINSIEEGSIYPSQYRIVTNRNNQSIKLSLWSIYKISEMTEHEEITGFISFYAPVKMLMRGTLHEIFKEEAKKGSKYTENRVVELSSDILYVDPDEARSKMEQLTRDFGVRFLLGEYGDEYCPVMRISLYPFDYVLLESSLCSFEALESPSVRSAIKIARDSGKTVIIDITGNSMLRSEARDAGVDCYMNEPAERRG